MCARRLSFFWLAVACSGIAAQPRAADIDSITLERTSCYGTCPIYKVTVRRDGAVIYDGTQFVKVTGHQSRKIPSEQFQRLVREIQRIGFFSLKDEYMHKDNPDGSIESVTDLPTTITTVRAGKLRKRVKNYYGGPQSLAALEKLIDKIAGSSAWTGREANEP
jgi:Domain of unknown function (DUF6438)